MTMMRLSNEPMKEDGRSPRAGGGEEKTVSASQRICSYFYMGDPRGDGQGKIAQSFLMRHPEFSQNHDEVASWSFTTVRPFLFYAPVAMELIAAGGCTKFASF